MSLLPFDYYEHLPFNYSYAMAGPRQPEPSQSNGISPSFSERVYEMHIQT